MSQSHTVDGSGPLWQLSMTVILHSYPFSFHIDWHAVQNLLYPLFLYLQKTVPCRMLLIREEVQQLCEKLYVA